MAKVDDSVSVRTEPGTDAAVIGKMFKGNAGEIVKRTEGWTNDSLRQCNRMGQQ